MHEITLAPDSNAVGKRIVELSIPPTINIMAIKRNSDYIAPNGSTKLMANDTLFVLTDDKDLTRIQGLRDERE
jgi:cell volume regulation protein A